MATNSEWNLGSRDFSKQLDYYFGHLLLSRAAPHNAIVDVQAYRLLRDWAESLHVGEA
jgi:hypothetical protein